MLSAGKAKVMIQLGVSGWFNYVLALIGYDLNIRGMWVLITFAVFSLLTFTGL